MRPWPLGGFVVKPQHQRLTFRPTSEVFNLWAAAPWGSADYG